ncbi:MAG: hypothetical protein LPK15_10945 [Alteromonadaceae bacterium]|uniref:hypothetical protein n=1 Tax=Marinobacter sp. TaxID=50741 RepID=UPI0029C509EC|nr:hypothetical protein [Marinobacter sp.]MDX5385466.1 hypothetical protein [Marinobacter sp.]MDX5440944.1 hypothetical protein [Alteromonadaceae bacterium]
MHTTDETPSLPQPLSEPNWEAGLRRSTKDGRLLALSPEPAMTGERAVDVNTWIRRKTESWLDLQNGNLLFGAEFSLMFLSLSLLTVMAAVGFTLEVGINIGRWDWGLPLFVLVGNLLISLPWGLCMHFLGNKAVKETPPVRLNRQRREVAMPRWTTGKGLQLPFWNSNSGLIAYIVLLLTIGFVFSAITQENASDEYRSTLVFWGLLILGTEILVISTYLFIALRLKKKHDPKLVYEIYPWEKLVAYIETRQDIGPSLMATHTVLTLAIPKPNDPESALAAASINVGHETAGLAQWECIRQFMENGPEACPDPKEDETLAHYKAKCRQARKEMSLLPWLVKKVGDWFFQRYLAHIITERRIKTLALKSLPEELKAWSAPLPKDQWAKPSEALQGLNQKLTDACGRGLRFTHMGPVSEWQAGREKKSPQKRGRGRFRA